MSQFGTPGELGQLGHTNSHIRSDSRNHSERICLIVNPKAGAGKAANNLDALKASAERAFSQWDIRETQGPGHATELAVAACEEGFHLVAAVGGDGTCHEVINGLVKNDKARSKQTAFCVLPFGTGSDLIKTLQTPKKLSEALWIAATGITLPSDVGKATFREGDTLRTRYFINVAGFGANGEVVRYANQSSKRFGGKATFVGASLKTIANYKHPNVRIHTSHVDKKLEWQGQLLSTFVANGSFCGGGMNVGHNGNMHDGIFNLTILPSLTAVQQLAHLPKLYNGQIAAIPGAKCVQADTIKATAPAHTTVYVDLDGELSGQLPVTLEILPRILPIRGGWVRSPIVETQLEVT
ncbi:MAG: diacylglycerol/lipid kinase family protein [Myxococcota bacterium]